MSEVMEMLLPWSDPTHEYLCIKSKYVHLLRQIKNTVTIKGASPSSLFIYLSWASILFKGYTQPTQWRRQKQSHTEMGGCISREPCPFFLDWRPQIAPCFPGFKFSQHSWLLSKQAQTAPSASYTQAIEWLAASHDASTVSLYSGHWTRSLPSCYPVG